MATNADDQAQATAVDDSTPVTEDDLRALKYGTGDVETTQVEDEPTETDEDQEEVEELSEEDGQTEDHANEDAAQAAPQFVKEFPYLKGDTPEEYAKSLEEAYKQSTSEAMRLKKLSEQAPPVTPATPQHEEDQSLAKAPASTMELWAEQQLQTQIREAYDAFKKEYPQVSEHYDAFTRRVATLSKTILEDEGRLAAPAELYNLAAASLGWERGNQPDGKDRLGMALKETAAASKTASANGKAAPKSRVTAEMIALNRKMYPGKTDDEIRKELEPYVQ